MKITFALPRWRPIRLLVVAGLLTATLPPGTQAQDLTTLTGRTYRFVKLVRIEPDGAVIDHSTGRTRVAFSELSPEERAKVKKLQAAPVELPAIVVTDKGGARFDYNNQQAPVQSSVDLAKRWLALESDARRKKEDRKNSQLLFDQRWWDRLPIRLELPNPANDSFMTPNYLKTEFQGLNLKQDSPLYNPFGLQW